MKSLNLIKIVGNIKFVYLRTKIISMTTHPEENTIKVAWKVVGLGMTRMILRYIPDQLWVKANMDK